MPSLERGHACAGAWELMTCAGAPQVRHRCTKAGAGHEGQAKGGQGDRGRLNHCPLHTCLCKSVSGPTFRDQ